MEKLSVSKNEMAGLTDDIKRQLGNISSWNFDIFEFSRISSNRPLRYVLYQSLASFDLLADFRIKEPVLMNFAARIEVWKSTKTYKNQHKNKKKKPKI